MRHRTATILRFSTLALSSLSFLLVLVALAGSWGEFVVVDGTLSLRVGDIQHCTFAGNCSSLSYSDYGATMNATRIAAMVWWFGLILLALLTSIVVFRDWRYHLGEQKAIAEREMGVTSSEERQDEGDSAVDVSDVGADIKDVSSSEIEEYEANENEKQEKDPYPPPPALPTWVPELRDEMDTKHDSSSQNHVVEEKKSELAEVGDQMDKAKFEADRARRKQARLDDMKQARKQRLRVRTDKPDTQVETESLLDTTRDERLQSVRMEIAKSMLPQPPLPIIRRQRQSIWRTPVGLLGGSAVSVVVACALWFSVHKQMQFLGSSVSVKPGQ